MPKIYFEPVMVESDADRVNVIGPDDMEIWMTPEAAIRTAGRLVAGSAEAIAKGKSLRRRIH